MYYHHCHIQVASFCCALSSFYVRTSCVINLYVCNYQFLNLDSSFVLFMRRHCNFFGSCFYFYSPRLIYKQQLFFISNSFLKQIEICGNVCRRCRQVEIILPACAGRRLLTLLPACAGRRWGALHGTRGRRYGTLRVTQCQRYQNQTWRRS